MNAEQKTIQVVTMWLASSGLPIEFRDAKVTLTDGWAVIHFQEDGHDASLSTPADRISRIETHEEPA